MPDYLIGFNIVRYTRKTKHNFSTHSLSCKYNELILIMYYYFRPVLITALITVQIVSNIVNKFGSSDY